MKEVLTKSFWEGVKKTFHEASRVRLQPILPCRLRPRMT